MLAVLSLHWQTVLEEAEPSFGVLVCPLGFVGFNWRKVAVAYIYGYVSRWK